MAMDPTLGSFQRIYLQIRRGAAGRLQLIATMKRPTGGALVALISQGSIARDGMVLDIVSDPSQDPTLTGPAGPAGKDGAAGPAGKDGAPGKDGLNGTNGTNGLPGKDGSPGKDGAAGANGLSAYQVARAQGYGGTETQWLASLVGAAGRDGTNGKDGAAGAPGKDGAAGPAGAPGKDGATGPAGPSAIGAPTARTINAATAYQATDKTKPAVVTINVASTAALTLTGGQTHTAELLIGPTAVSVTGTATGGTAIARYSNSNTGALSVGLAISTIDGKPITAHLPAGWVFALRIVSGTVTIVSAFDQAVG